MSSLMSVNVDEKEIKKLCRERIGELINEVNGEYVFWDSTELKKRTCMSWNAIQDTFFFDNRFIKRKIGTKWYFPAREARSFLIQWLEEQAIN